MLYGPRQEAMLAELVRPSGAILGLNPDALSPRDLRNVSRYGETPLKIGLITEITNDARVNQFIGTPLRLNNSNVQRFAKLRGGEAYARSGAHCVREIIEKRVEQFAETLDWGTSEAKARITKEQDWSDAHGQILPIARGASLDRYQSSGLALESAAGMSLGSPPVGSGAPASARHDVGPMPGLAPGCAHHHLLLP